MFQRAKYFNQNISSWDISNVKYMGDMFKDAENFNQNLNAWDTSSVRDNLEMFWGSGIKSLPKWWKKKEVENVEKHKWIDEVMEKTTQAEANPRSKEERQKEKEQKQAQKQAQKKALAEQKAKEKKNLKKLFIIVFVATIIVSFVFNLISGDDETSTPKQSSAQAQSASKAQTQQPQQKPTLITPKCNDKSMLNDLYQFAKNDLRQAFKRDSKAWANAKEKAKAKGVELTSIDEYVDGISFEYLDAKTIRYDEINHQAECTTRAILNNSTLQTTKIWLWQFIVQTTEQGKDINITKLDFMDNNENLPKSTASNESENIAQNSAQDDTPSQNTKPSFDCAKASTNAEKLVCSDDELARLDNELANAYKNALNSLDNASKKQLTNEQKSWLKTYNQCTDKECVKYHLQMRIWAL